MSDTLPMPNEACPDLLIQTALKRCEQMEHVYAAMLEKGLTIQLMERFVTAVEKVTHA